MKTALVGYTGFVGSNLNESFNFTYKFNSHNIENAFDLRPDILVYAGVRAEKFLANANPEKDREKMIEAFDNVKRIRPRKVILISTVDVYKQPDLVDENTPIEIENLQPYGANRFFLENCVRKEYPDALIIRLPGLFGINIKKNFIYDFINSIPSMLNSEKYCVFSSKESLIGQFYKLQDNGFYKCSILNEKDKVKLKAAFERLGFSALNFTDSRGVFQFYPLRRLWRDIEIAQNAELKLVNMATEPIEISELHKALTGKEFINHVSNVVPRYDFHTIHDTLYGGHGGYLYSKNDILEEIKKFVQESMQ